MIKPEWFFNEEIFIVLFLIILEIMIMKWTYDKTKAKIIPSAPNKKQNPQPKTNVNDLCVRIYFE